MGTNYYLYEKPPCACCKREYEPLHIGKSSGGWCFALHVMPEQGINNLDDWRRLWSDHDAVIKNEYGEVVPVELMETVITKREWRGEHPRRHKGEGRHCVGHGSGPWDYITGEFS